MAVVGLTLGLTLGICDDLTVGDCEGTVGEGVVV